MTEFLLNHYPEILNGLVLLITGGFWYDAKKKKAELKRLNATVKSDEADATKKIVDLYQESIDDLEKRYKARYVEMEQFYKERIEQMKDSIRKELRAEMEPELTAQMKLIEELRKEVKSLRSNLELWKTKYRKLKEEFDRYREKHGDK